MSETSAVEQSHTIVIVGHPNSDAYTDERLVNLFILLVQCDSVVFAVSTKYSSINSIDIPKNMYIIPDEPALVFNHRARLPPADGGFPSYQAPHNLSVYTERMSSLRSTDAKVTYICVDPRLARDCYALAALVRTERYVNRFWFVGPYATLENLVRVCTGEEKVNVPVAIPNVFTGLPPAIMVLRDHMRPHERHAFDTLVLEGLCILRCYLRAGYHLRKNRGPIPGWAAQVGGRWLAGLIGVFAVQPGEIDKNLQESFLESSCMRMVLCEATLYALSNYFTFTFPKGRYVDEATLQAAYDDQVASGDGPYYLHPDMNERSEEHRDLVAWHSIKLWDGIYEKFCKNAGV